MLLKTATNPDPILLIMDDNKTKPQFSCIVQNVNGLNYYTKRLNILTTMASYNADLTILVDTRLPELIQKQIQMTCNSMAYFSGSDSSEKGIAILIKNNSDLKVTNVIRDDKGQLLMIELIHAGNPILVVAVYGDPRGDPVDWWQNLMEKVENLGHHLWVMAGDFNLYFNHQTDTDRLTSKRNARPKSAAFFNNLFSNGDAVDAFRTLHPTKRSFTWRSWDRHVSLGKRTRIDHCIVSPGFMPYVNDVEHLDSPFAYDLDHKLIKLTWSYSNFSPGPGNFRCQRGLENNPDYQTIIENCIRNTAFDHVDWPKVS